MSIQELEKEVMVLRAIVRHLLAANPESAKELIALYGADAAPKPVENDYAPPDYYQLLPGVAYARVRELAQQSLRPAARATPETFLET